MKNIFKSKKILIDNKLTAVEGGWKFDSNISKVFDKHVRKSIPFYDEIQKNVSSLSEWFIKDGSIYYDIGCSTGQTIYNIFQRHNNKDIKIYGLDIQNKMIQIAKKKNKSKNIKFLKKDFNKKIKLKKNDFTTCLFTINFLKKIKRLKMLKTIFDSLNAQGAFVLVEKVNSSNILNQSIFTEMYYDFKIDNKLSHLHIINKAKSLRGVMTPLTEEENIRMLKKVGFKKIEVFFKWFNFSGILAIKD